MALISCKVFAGEGGGVLFLAWGFRSLARYQTVTTES